MTTSLLLAIDVGTQSVRAIVFDTRGSVIARVQVLLTPPFVSPKPGWAEQDPEVYWRAVVEAVTQLWDAGRVDPLRIAGLALTT